MRIRSFIFSTRGETMTYRKVFQISMVLAVLGSGSVYAQSGVPDNDGAQDRQDLRQDRRGPPAGPRGPPPKKPRNPNGKKGILQGERGPPPGGAQMQQELTTGA